MIRNYLKIAWRNLVNQKLYSFINIFGLAVGLAVCMMIMLYVTHEISYDRFHKNAGRIFSPQVHLKIAGNSLTMAQMSYPSAPVIKQSQPVVEAYMRTLKYNKPVIINSPSSKNIKFSEHNFLFADTGFFNFFSFKLLSGNAAEVLKKPFSVVISKDMAKKYFGSQEPIGKTLTIKTDSTYTYQITGVAENAPSNSSIHFNFITSNESLFAMKGGRDYVDSQQIETGSFDNYLLLKHTSDTAILRKGMNLMVKGKKRMLGNNVDEEKFSFTGLTDTHLKSNFADSTNIKYLKIFPIVAVLILLLALVNYMSLSTARATLRAKEIGVRIVSGASRKTIAIQFYVESALLVSLAFMLGYLLCYLFKPRFLNFLQLKIDNSFLYSPLVLVSLLGLLLFTILIAGSYPSLVLSGFKPVITLKGKMSKQAGGVTVRKVFTTLQFAISVGLIICGIIIDRQLYYFRHAEIGIDKNNMVMIPISTSFGKNYAAFKHDIQSLSGVSSVATSHYSIFGDYDIYFINGKNKNENIRLSALKVDNQYISALGLKWKFPPKQPNELVNQKKVVINEEAVVKLHLPANPVGSFIQSGDKKYEVAGVLKNFNYYSMEYTIDALGLFITPDTASYFKNANCNLLAKINAHTNLPSLIHKMESLYKKYDQDTPFSYSFMDDAFNEQYKAEDQLASIFSVFTCITVILATMGLFGLATFTIEQRTKEIGIRKVLGAGLTAIITLLSKDFLKLVLLSILIASPIAWWSMHNWLQNFAYRIAINWWIFALAGGIAVFISVITVSFQSLRAAVANPVKSLKNE